MIWLGALLGPVVIGATSFLYLAWYLKWERRNTSGVAYYGKPLVERRDLKERIRRYSLVVMPLVRLLAVLDQKRRTMPAFEYEGVCGPPNVSSPEVFRRAKDYRPRAEDVFVATQMRCGTTWMQQVVYEIVHRGAGDLGDRGHGHLYAACPWIDGVNSVSLKEAPLVGERPTRIIKTHLPTRICPYGEEARYIYVTRHPVSCFASIVDYQSTLLGPLTPSLANLADWFCSDRMYWWPWPKHVSGWWRWAEDRPNVLFIHYEEIVVNFAGVLDRVADFLGYQLSARETRRVEEKCSFQYMKDNEEVFEMSPPNMFSVRNGSFLVSGGVSRREDVTPAVRRRILDYCRESLRDSDYPAYQFYSDLGVPTADRLG